MQFFGFDGISLVAAIAAYYITSVIALYITLWLIRGGKMPLWGLMLLGIVGIPLIVIYGLAALVGMTWVLMRKARTLLAVEVGRD